MWGERALPLALMLASCTGDEGTEPDTPVVETGTAECLDTWESWASGFLRTWCTSCHSSELGEGQRYDAPVGIDFDTYASTVALAALIERSATGDDADMPPVGGPPAHDRERLATWFACGAPGLGGTEPGACDGPPSVSAGDVTIASEADAAALCAAATAVDGDLVVRASVDLGCLCEVTGDVTVGAGATSVALPNLATVGGDFALSGASELATLDVDRLADVGGSVLVADAPLVDVRLPALRTVAGDVSIARLPVADRVDLSRLETVGGSLVLEDIPALRVLLGEGYGLEEIGGDLVLDDLDAWVGFYGFALLERIGGAVVIRDNDAIVRINGFTALTEAHGLRVEGNAALEAIDGLDQLATLEGDLVITGNPSLDREVGLPALRTVTGAVRLEGNAALASLEGLLGVVEAGSLRIAANASLWHLGVWDLRAVAGDLELVDNAALVDVSGLHGLESVGGDVAITGNASLGAADADALAAAIEAIGGSRDVGNNGP